MSTQQHNARRQKVLLKSAVMRKLILILLLTLLPLQWASAAVDLLCFEEAHGSVLQHAGSHADHHQHDTEIKKPSQAEQIQAKYLVDHHHLIHHADCHAFISTVEPLKFEPARIYSALQAPSLLSCIASEPERPKWRCAA